MEKLTIDFNSHSNPLFCHFDPLFIFEYKSCFEAMGRAVREAKGKHEIR
jgi:hypothetical protein